MNDAQGDGRLEKALARTEADADAAIAAASGLLGQLRKTKKAAALGTLRDLGKGLDAAGELAATLAERVTAARAGWHFDDRAYLESGSYARDLLDAARERGLPLVEQDDRLVTFPSIVRLLPADAAVEIDRKKLRSLRPSAVVAALAAARDRPVRFRPEPFLEALLGAYRLVLAERGKEPPEPVALADVYRVWTIAPGSRATYSKQEFARDLHELDVSGVQTTKDGHRVSLPASTGTRGGQVLATVTREGRIQQYYAVAFRR